MSSGTQPFVWVVSFPHDPPKDRVQPVAFESKDEANRFAVAEGARLGRRTIVTRALNQSEINRRLADVRMLASMGSAVQEGIERASS